jgi:hypothetical protein
MYSFKLTTSVKSSSDVSRCLPNLVCMELCQLFVGKGPCGCTMCNPQLTLHISSCLFTWLFEWLYKLVQYESLYRTSHMIWYRMAHMIQRFVLYEPTHNWRWGSICSKTQPVFWWLFFPCPPLISFWPGTTFWCLMTRISGFGHPNSEFSSEISTKLGGLHSDWIVTWNCRRFEVPFEDAVWRENISGCCQKVGLYEGCTPIIQWDKNAGPHEEEEYLKFMRAYCKERSWHLEPQAQQMPHMNNLDVLVFPMMSKQHDKEVDREYAGGLHVLKEDEIWATAEKVLRNKE